MRRKLLVLCFTVAFLFTAIGWSLLFQTIPTAAGQIDPDNLIRLHVIANSDSERDQAVKIKVRDAVIHHLQPKFAECQTVDQSRTVIEEETSNIINVAQEVLAFEGMAYHVTLQTGYYDFPIKSYGTITFPAGKYEAVKIILGNGEGKNWWCVLFPPLCFIDATNATAVQENKQDKKVEFRWKLIEMIQSQ